MTTMPSKSWIDDLDATVADNLARVAGLVVVYEERVGVRQGRADVASSDILRAAVVLLHATLEEALRAALERRLPLMPADSLADLLVPLAPPAKPKEKVTLKDLALLQRDTTVSDLIVLAVSHWLASSNFNNVGDVVAALTRVEIPHGLTQDQRSDLESLMKRRHWIAHRADRNRQSGPGQHTAASLGKKQVQAWSALVAQIGQSICASLRTMEGNAS